MGEAKRRGTFEQRARAAGRNQTPVEKALYASAAQLRALVKRQRAIFARLFGGVR